MSPQPFAGTRNPSTETAPFSEMDKRALMVTDGNDGTHPSILWEHWPPLLVERDGPRVALSGKIECAHCDCKQGPTDQFSTFEHTRSPFRRSGAKLVEDRAQPLLQTHGGNIFQEFVKRLTFPSPLPIFHRSNRFCHPASTQRMEMNANRIER
jgi:hypothetical protein